MLLTTAMASTETVTVRTGNGPVGGRDAAVTFLLGPQTGSFGRAFTSADFANAQTGPNAYIVSPNPLWIPGLSADSAKWIGTNANSGLGVGNTALYAVSFQITNPFANATLELSDAADDGIGEAAGGGPNTGVYLNGTAVCGNSFVIGFSQEHSITCGSVGPTLHLGTNWLYIEDGNAEGPAGLLFSATITTAASGTLLTVPGNAMPWLYSTNPGGVNYAYQYGLDDGANPVIVSAANGFDFTTGGTLTITYLSGMVSVGPEIPLPYTDADGLVNDTATSTGTFAPGHYMSPVAFIGELVGTFADANGAIVGTPFAIGDGPTNLTIPLGATQLQLGVDDDKFSDNVGWWVIQVRGPSAPAFFAGQVPLGSGVYYLQFPDNNLFGYYKFVASSIFYHYDLGYEAFIPGSAADVYFCDFSTGHWLYTSSTLFPYLYDFALKTWIYYFPSPTNPGHYTSDPRYFSNLTTGKIFTM
jgi:hypothetical protein